MKITLVVTCCMWITRYLEQQLNFLLLFCFGKFNANNIKSFIWLLLLTQVQAFSYMCLLVFWEDLITVWRTENLADKHLHCFNVFLRIHWNEYVAQNSCASDESLLLCFEVSVFPFPLNYSCQFFFLWRHGQI